jgi:hypothetical protein
MFHSGVQGGLWTRHTHRHHPTSWRHRPTHRNQSVGAPRHPESRGVANYEALVVTYVLMLQI